MANHEYRIQRGRILKMLYTVYDGPLNLRNIALNLDDMGLKTHISVVKAHCTFLRDRGLVTIEEVRSGEIEDIQVKLTWQGVLFVEKGESDDGIDLGV